MSTCVNLIDLPVGSIYGVFTYIWLMFFVVDVAIYGIPGMDPMGYPTFVGCPVSRQNHCWDLRVI